MIDPLYHMQNHVFSPNIGREHSSQCCVSLSSSLLVVCSWELHLHSNRGLPSGSALGQRSPGVPLFEMSPHKNSTFYCLFFSFNREITVTLGAHDVSKTESTQQKIKVKKQIAHPQYSLYSNLHDIMLLKVLLSFLPFLALPSFTLIIQPTSSEPTPKIHVLITPVGKNPCPGQHASLGYHVFSPSPYSFKEKLSSLRLWIQLPCLAHLTSLYLEKCAVQLAGDELE